jgi:hypothetical protein
VYTPRRAPYTGPTLRGADDSVVTCLSSCSFMIHFCAEAMQRASAVRPPSLEIEGLPGIAHADSTAHLTPLGPHHMLAQIHTPALQMSALALNAVTDPSFAIDPSSRSCASAHGDMALSSFGFSTFSSVHSCGTSAADFAADGFGLESRARAPHSLTPAGISVVSPLVSAALCIVASFASSVLYQSLWLRALDDAVAPGFTLLLCQLCRHVLDVGWAGSPSAPCVWVDGTLPRLALCYVY